ncbi:MAG: FAD-dependent oxidoreductase [Acidobacteriota bacterium]
MKYPLLFQPGQIGRLELPNRVIMAAMFVGYGETDGRFSQAHIDYFVERARGGAGLLVTESVLADTSIQPIPEEAPVTTCQSDAVIPRLQELARAVHQAGARISFQVSPGQGRQSHFAAQNKPVAPSVVPAFMNPNISCRALKTEEVQMLVRACGQGSMRAAIAGFDMIEIHAHTGYLIDQFMTPLWNRRDDQYGGSFENRMRFAAEIVQAIKERAGVHFPVGFRLTAEHRIPGGRTLDDGVRMARHLEEAGVDALTVDAGCYEVEYWMNPPVYLGEACLVDLAGAVRRAVGIPVIAAGNLLRPDLAEQVLKDGQADFVALGRSLLADAEWVNKARQGRLEEIRPCIMCNEYCLGRLPSACMVNAALGKEREYAPKAAPRPKKVVVIGGGPGGMEVARVAALRGHQVTLYERESVLGGQLLSAADAYFKSSLGDLRDNLAHQIEQAGVQVKLNCPATLENVEAERPDAVVVASGALPLLPEIPGIGLPGHLTVLDLHSNRNGERGLGETVLIAGGGLNGCDAAIDLAAQGKKVTVVEMASEVARDMNHISRGALLAKLSELGIQLRTGCEIVRFTAKGARLRGPEGEVEELQADTVVLALGARSENGLLERLQGKVQELYAIGDCLKPRKIGEAIHEGYKVGLKL